MPLKQKSECEFGQTRCEFGQTCSVKTKNKKSARLGKLGAKLDIQV